MERLKQKVASSSSRVIASLQQAASGTASAAASSPSSGSRAAPEVPPLASAPLAPNHQHHQQHYQHQQQQHQASASSSYPAQNTSSAFVGAGGLSREEDLQSRSVGLAENVCVEGAGSAASKLMNTNATAHLTEEEREILLQVFKKEEQFQRDTIK